MPQNLNSIATRIGSATNNQPDLTEVRFLMNPASRIPHNGNRQPRMPSANPSDNKQNPGYSLGTNEQRNKSLLRHINNRVLRAFKYAKIEQFNPSLRDPNIKSSAESVNRPIDKEHVLKTDILASFHFKESARKVFGGNIRLRQCLSQLYRLYNDCSDDLKIALARSVCLHMDHAQRRFIGVVTHTPPGTNKEEFEPFVLSKSASIELVKKSLDRMCNHAQHSTTPNISTTPSTAVGPQYKSES